MKHPSSSKSQEADLAKLGNNVDKIVYVLIRGQPVQPESTLTETQNESGHAGSMLGLLNISGVYDCQCVLTGNIASIA
jgi:hypothetical protein